jgi:hypothetical protein
VGYFGHVAASDIAIIWCYDIICLVVIDCVKVLYFNQLRSQCRQQPYGSMVGCRVWFLVEML